MKWLVPESSTRYINRMTNEALHKGEAFTFQTNIKPNPVVGCVEPSVGVISVIKPRSHLQVRLCKCWQIVIGVPGSCCEERREKRHSNIKAHRYKLKSSPAWSVTLISGKYSDGCNTH